MSPYHRAKREDAAKPEKMEMAVEVGSVDDSFESLVAMCNDKSNEIMKSVELKDGEELEVQFWTGNFPELIGISTITKNEAGMPMYHFDDSLTTL